MADLQPDTGPNASGHIVSACQAACEIHNRLLRPSIMHHAVANADTNYHIGPKHDNAPPVLEALAGCCRGDYYLADDQPRLVSTLRRRHDLVLRPRDRSGSAQHGGRYAYPLHTAWSAGSLQGRQALDLVHESRDI